MFHVSSKNTSDPEVPYFISRNASISSSNTLRFQMYNTLSLAIAHFQKCFIFNNGWNPERPHLYSRKCPLVSPDMFLFHLQNALFYLQKCLSSRNAFHLVSRNAFIQSPEIPCLISRSTSSLEVFQLVSGNAHDVSRKVSHVAQMLQQLQTRFPQDLLWRGQEEMGWPLPLLPLGPTTHPLGLPCSRSKNKGQSRAGRS